MAFHILEFKGDYDFLSNFYLEPDGTHVEGEYQARKTIPPTYTLQLLEPGRAKRVGRAVKLRPDWDKVKVGIMQELVSKKFQDHPSLAAKLKATGKRRRLLEGNNWGDDFWGVVPYADGWVGENWLGKILMDVRDFEL